MSAWVVSNAHIDAMVSAAIHFGGGFREPFDVYHDGKRTEVTRANATEIGQRLLDECVRSVSHRYPNDDASGVNPYAFERTRDFALAEIAKMVACYGYQSCEHPAWERSWARAFCRALEARVLRSLPGYEQAPWGFEAEHVAFDAPRKALEARCTVLREQLAASGGRLTAEIVAALGPVSIEAKRLGATDVTAWIRDEVMG